MSIPISPPPVQGGAGDELPAYLSNGVIGLRVRDNPLTTGMTLVSGYTGEHPRHGIEAAAVAPYPVGCDLRLGGVWLSDAPQRAQILDQAYDFATGELTSRLVFEADGVRAQVEVLTFCSRSIPSLVCQEITLSVDGAADISLKASLDARMNDGSAHRVLRAVPNTPPDQVEGALLWESLGGVSRVGLAYVTQLDGADASVDRPTFTNNILETTRELRARSGSAVRLRQMAALVSSAQHSQPDYEAVRQLVFAGQKGFDGVRAENRAVWEDLWRGRIEIEGAPQRWQALSDAALFYLLSSAHVASPASTSMFGLATWKNYHYYYGHVMWDIEAFGTPVLSLLQPRAARSLLGYRFGHLAGAVQNARLRGRLGAQFPWAAAASTGEEATPAPGGEASREEHVSLDVANAFAFHARVSGDDIFLREQAWPVVSAVAEWIADRAEPTARGREFRASTGIAERKAQVDNPAFTAMAAAGVLRAAIEMARRLGVEGDAEWDSIAQNLVLPMRGQAIVTHEGWRANEEKGATPEPLMGVFPLAYPMSPEVEAATLATFLPLADQYIGSPMLSALYGVWAARAGDRSLSARLMEEGYGRFISGRFLQTLEYRPDRFPEQPQAGPFFANLGGFLMGLLIGFPGLEVSDGDPAGWARRPVVLPRGWKSIAVERLWLHGRPWRLEAHHGDLAAKLEPAK